MRILAVLFLMNLGNIEARNRDCYYSKPEYISFGTKASYPKINLNKSEPLPANCAPIQLRLISRHGVKNPSERTVRRLNKLHETRKEILYNHQTLKRGYLCYKDLQNLKAWTFNLTEEYASLITEQGKRDLIALGKRFAKRFPSLFEAGYTESRFLFRYTENFRTEQSAEYFARGLFGTEAMVQIGKPPSTDNIIKPYANCLAWHRAKEKVKEIDLFLQGPEMKKVRKNVGSRLGYNRYVDNDQIDSMYDACRYQKAWKPNEISPWCAAFSHDDLLIMEYYQDLIVYYNGAYGLKENIRLGCMPTKDAFEEFEKLQANKPTFEGVFYFGHSDILSMLMAYLGIASSGVPLRHDNYMVQKKRVWNSTVLLPFSANIAAVFVRCETGEKHRVLLYVNEKPVYVRGCAEHLCPWKKIKELYKSSFDCNLTWCESAALLEVSLNNMIVFLLPFLVSFYS